MVKYCSIIDVYNTIFFYSFFFKHVRVPKTVSDNPLYREPACGGINTPACHITGHPTT